MLVSVLHRGLYFFYNDFGLGAIIILRVDYIIVILTKISVDVSDSDYKFVSP